MTTRWPLSRGATGHFSDEGSNVLPYGLGVSPVVPRLSSSGDDIRQMMVELVSEPLQVNRDIPGTPIPVLERGVLERGVKGYGACDRHEGLDCFLQSPHTR